MTKKVLYIIAPKDFRDEEYFEPKAILEDNNIQVVTASKDINIAMGKLGKNAKINIDISQINVDEYDAIIFAGGSGAVNYIKNKIINKIINKANENKILICAICIAPLILAYNGILKDKNVTMWNSNNEQKNEIEKLGANFVDEKVVVDKNIITANGPTSAKLFGEKIVELLN